MDSQEYDSNRPLNPRKNQLEADEHTAGIQQASDLIIKSANELIEQDKSSVDHEDNLSQDEGAANGINFSASADSSNTKSGS